MPFVQRLLEPTHVSRVEVGQGVKNELECVTNHTLGNIIRQLSSLSKHAEDMFADLFFEANTFFGRANQLQHRIEHLRVKVTSLDATVEEGRLRFILCTNLAQISSPGNLDEMATAKNCCR